MKKIAIIILSEPLTYPPTINAANILAENKWQVNIYGIKYNTTDNINCHKNVNINYVGSNVKGIRNVLQYFYFYLWIIGKLIVDRPKIIISYDPLSVGPAIVSSWLFKIKWFYHVHDFIENPKGWYKILKYIERKFVNKAYNISFPQIERARIYKEEYNIKNEIDIVLNGPRKNWIKSSLPNLKVLEIKNKFDNIILYQGGISKHFNLEPLLMAIDICKSNFAICIIGRELETGVIDFYKSILKTDKQKNRLFFLEPTSYDKLPSITSLADIGLAKLTSNKKAPINDFYLIGASNKISEYCAFGLPILFPKTSINEFFLKNNNIGLMIDTSDYYDIAKKIDLILLNHEIKNKMKSQSLEIFSNFLNFDFQFEKIRIKLEEVA